MPSSISFGPTEFVSAGNAPKVPIVRTAATSKQPRVNLHMLLFCIFMNKLSLLVQLSVQPALDLSPILCHECSLKRSSLTRSFRCQREKNKPMKLSRTDGVESGNLSAPTPAVTTAIHVGEAGFGAFDDDF
jgi:hypothetical protein